MHKIKFFLALIIWLSGLNYSAFACTSVCLVKNGCVVFGNNLDWFVDDGMIFINKRNVKKKGLWFENSPEWVSKYASITTNQEGREFPSRGMNETGLAIGEMWLGPTEYPDRDSRPAVSTLQWIQYQLDNCATIAEVIATDKTIRIDKDEYHSHFFVCDSSGNCATIEWLDGKLQAHAYDEVPVKVLVNSTYASCLSTGDDPSGRFGKAAKMLARHTTENPVNYVFSVLQAVSQPHTRWSLVCDAKNRIFYLKTARNPDVRYIRLSDFDFSCESDVHMIDMNRSGSGDITNQLIPFTSEMNAQLVRSTLGQLEPRFGPFSEDVYEKIIDYPRTTECLK